MATSALRELVLGVADLTARTRFYEEVAGLAVVARGRLDQDLGGALWGLSKAVEIVTLARPDVPGAPRIRLVQLDGPPARSDASLLPPPLTSLTSFGRSRRSLRTDSNPSAQQQTLRSHVWG